VPVPFREVYNVGEMDARANTRRGGQTNKARDIPVLSGDVKSDRALWQLSVVLAEVAKWDKSTRSVESKKRTKIRDRNRRKG